MPSCMYRSNDHGTWCSLDRTELPNSTPEVIVLPILLITMLGVATCSELFGIWTRRHETTPIVGNNLSTHIIVGTNRIEKMRGFLLRRFWRPWRYHCFWWNMVKLLALVWCASVRCLTGLTLLIAELSEQLAEWLRGLFPYSSGWEREGSVLNPSTRTNSPIERRCHRKKTKHNKTKIYVLWQTSIYIYILYIHRFIHVSCPFNRLPRFHGKKVPTMQDMKNLEGALTRFTWQAAPGRPHFFELVGDHCVMYIIWC